jgi:hypothetical protein
MKSFVIYGCGSCEGYVTQDDPRRINIKPKARRKIAIITSTYLTKLPQVPLTYRWRMRLVRIGKAGRYVRYIAGRVVECITNNEAGCLRAVRF